MFTTSFGPSIWNPTTYRPSAPAWKYPGATRTHQDHQEYELPNFQHPNLSSPGRRPPVGDISMSHSLRDSPMQVISPDRVKMGTSRKQRIHLSLFPTALRRVLLPFQVPVIGQTPSISQVCPSVACLLHKPKRPYTKIITSWKVLSLGILYEMTKEFGDFENYGLLNYIFSLKTV